ncbi:MAG: RimK/LysX family protein [Ilumatobacter sp.]|uniref:ATP-dependent zinc protease family protein n=2 Tax=Ilumatobacter sp. TaxID=1967498 RepID=UPI0032994DA8
MADATRSEPTLVGWREWLAFPEWGIPAVKVKIDSGARTSALHVDDLEIVERDGRRIATFIVHPWQRSERDGVEVSVPLVDERSVTSSSGETTTRPVVMAVIELDGRPHEIELTLTRRDDMGFRMLLGRKAMEGRYLVDPSHSYLTGRPDLATRRRNRSSA